MIARSEIEKNLRSLNRRFLWAKSHKEELYASKFAIIELGGWIEMSMDDVIERCAIRHLSVQDNRDYCHEQIISRTYGFEYHKHFRGMLARLLGLVNVERLERVVDGPVHSAFLASLSAMKVARDSEAHTYIKGAAKAINAPSVTIVHYQQIDRGLSQIDEILRSRRW